MDDLNAYLHPHFVDTLLAMQTRTADRDQDLSWLEYNNFGEWYADNRHLFVVGYSQPDMMVAKLVELYLVRQLNVLVKASGERDAYGRATSLLRPLIAEHFPAIKARLQKSWPKELEQIVAANRRFRMTA